MIKVRRQKVRIGALCIAFLLLPVILFYFSPYLIVAGAFEGVVAGSAISFAVLFVLSFVLRRAFCGWACSTGGLQELERSAVDEPFAHPRANLLKWAIWVPWMSAIVSGAILAGGIHAVDPIYHTPHGLSVSSVLGLCIYLVVVAAFFVPNLFLGRRAMCHCICWMAPFMIAGGKLGELLRLPQLHVSSEPDLCIHCGRCDRDCPMSLPVEALAAEGRLGACPECIQCAACCDACPRDVLKLELGQHR